jgi:hypothetical protein
MDPVVAARSFVGMIVHHGNIYAVHCPGMLQGSPETVVNTVVDVFLFGMTK